MARLLVGLPQLAGKLESYADRYGMVEVRPIDEPLPPPDKLRRWRERVPPGFAFSVALPQAVAALAPGRELDEALASSLATATSLEAACIVLCTPPAVRPTRLNRDRLAAVARALPRPGVVLGWQPSGIWEIEDVFETARACDLLPVLDAARDPLPPGPVAYTRLRALGKSTRIGAAGIDLIAEQLAGRRDAFVVADRQLAGRVRAELPAAIERQRAQGPSGAVLRLGLGAALPGDDEEQ